MSQTLWPKKNYMHNQHLRELNYVSRFLLHMGKNRMGAWQMLCKISQLSRGVSSDYENTGQESGVLISTEFSLLSSCCLKNFFLQSNCFIAMQGVFVSQQKTMDKHYQYWRSPWWSPGWQGEVSLCGMRTGTGLLKTSVVKNDSRKMLFSSICAEELFRPLCRKILMELILFINNIANKRTNRNLPQDPCICQCLRQLDFFPDVRYSRQ